MLVSKEVLINKMVRICDFCEEKQAKTQCYHCKKDCRNNCIEVQEYDLWTTNYYGDYADYLCEKCDKQYKSFKVLEKLRLLDEEYDKKVEIIKEEFNKYYEN